MVKRREIKLWSLWVVMFLVLMVSVSGVSYFADEASAVDYKNKNPEFVFNAEDTEITEVEWDTETSLLHVCWQSHYTRNGKDKWHDGCMQIDKSLSLDEQRRLVYQAAQEAFEADTGIEKVVVVYKTHPLLDTPNRALNKIMSVQPVNETLPEQIIETPVEEIPVNPTNSAPVIVSFSPESDVAVSVGESQEFTITSSDADNDPLSVQWYVNNLAVSGEVSDSYTFASSELGEFEVKVLVTDGKDYSTHKWAVTVSEAEQSFGITGAAVGLAKQGAKQGSSLLGWLASLFS